MAKATSGATKAGGAASTDEGKDKTRLDGWFKLGALAILAAVGVFGIVKLTQTTAGGTLAITPGGVTLTQNAQDSFSDLLSKAIDSDSAAVEGLLEKRGYFKLSGDSWVNELRQMKLEDGVARSARQLLFDLAGPFAPAQVALDGADERLLKAVATLHDGALKIDPDTAQEANAFLAAIWQANLEQDGVFEPRSFSASVSLQFNAPEAGEGRRHIIYVCPGSVLENKELSLWFQRDEGRSFIVDGMARVDRRFNSCAKARSLKQLLANQPARIGLSPAAFGELYGPVRDGETSPSRLDAQFQVRPSHLSAAVVLGQ